MALIRSTERITRCGKLLIPDREADSVSAREDTLQATQGQSLYGVKVFFTSNRGAARGIFGGLVVSHIDRFCLLLKS